MRLLLVLIISLGISSKLLAREHSYKWILDRYHSNDASEIKGFAKGRINGVEYTAIIVSRVSEKIDYDPEILVFKKVKNNFEPVTQLSLGMDNTAGYSVDIDKDSIFLKHQVGHHGIHGSRYQFKIIDEKFRMVGAETRSESLGCYAGDSSPKCDEYEAWSGVSYNFLTTSAICWRAKFMFPYDQSYEIESRRGDGWSFPKNAISRTISIKESGLKLLEGFDFIKVNLPNACYFNSKNKLVYERKSP